MYTEIDFIDTCPKKEYFGRKSRAIVTISLLATIFHGTKAEVEQVQLSSSSSSPGSYTISLYSISNAAKPGNPGSSSTFISKSGQTLYPVMFPTITLDSQLFANPPCVAIFFKYYATSQQAGVSRSVLPQLLLAAHRLYPYCIDRSITISSPPSNPVNDITVVRDVISRQLPSPNPSFDPPFSLVSLNAYLSTGASVSDHLDTTTPIGRVTADASGTLTIDFGDGTTPITTTSTGGPYPNGNIVHAWTSTGCYRVTVTENWSVNYTTPNGSGSISGITTFGEIPQYCVFSTTSQIYR
ncbi:MAG: hypothetical protein M0019_07140 [Actinomycetota bacterium]|nr:hypothetical protein [Actinomycetota bacterium]